MYKNILGAALRSAPIRADAAAQRLNFKIVGAGEKAIDFVRPVDRIKGEMPAAVQPVFSVQTTLFFEPCFPSLCGG